MIFGQFFWFFIGSLTEQFSGSTGQGFGSWINWSDWAVRSGFNYTDKKRVKQPPSLLLPCNFNFLIFSNFFSKTKLGFRHFLHTHIVWLVKESGGKKVKEKKVEEKKENRKWDNFFNCLIKESEKKERLNFFPLFDWVESERKESSIFVEWQK